MFKVGDIVKTKYDSGGGSFQVVEIIDNIHMLVISTNPDFPFNVAVKFKDWEIDPIQYREKKITKILGKI